MQGLCHTHGNTSPRYDSSGITENDEVYASCNTSPLVHPPQDQPQPQPQPQQNTNWHGLISTLQQTSPTHKNLSSTNGSFPPSNPTLQAQPPLSKFHAQNREINIIPRIRHESIDSGYGSICSSNSNTTSHTTSQSNSNPNSNCWSPNLSNYEDPTPSITSTSSSTPAPTLTTHIQPQLQPQVPRKLSQSSCRDFVYENSNSNNTEPLNLGLGLQENNELDTFSANIKGGIKEEQDPANTSLGMEGYGLGVGVGVGYGYRYESGYATGPDDRAMSVDPSVVIIS